MRSYAWLAAAATLLALFVPLTLAPAASAQTTVPPELVGDRDPYTLEQEAETATLNAVPETATNLVGTAHTITATYANRAAQPQPIDTTKDDPATTPQNEAGERVVFKIVQGPNRVSATNAAVNKPGDPAVPPGVFGACETEADGTCQQSYTGADTGRDVILVFVDKDGDLTLDDDEAADVVDKTWVGPNDAGASSRLWGNDRIETAVEISKALYNNGAA
ncbi:MAG: cell wall-binding repeat-containing protein, partial [Actinomycetota bacterium]|nr:cell wall-binding repeat-containing protein [Actinomycetota bacterium]